MNWKYAFCAAGLLFANAASAETDKLTLGDVSPVAASWPMYVAEDFGYFKDEGLDVTYVYTGNNAAVVQQLIGGSLDIGISTVETTIRAVEAGASVKIVGSGMLKYPYSIMVPASIKDAADMKGKRIILPLPKSAPTIYWNRWLREHGLQPGDVEQVFDGSTPNRFAALQSGTVQAAVLTQPFDQVASDKGYIVLLDLGQYAKDFGFTAILATDKFIAQKPDVIRKFLKAEARAIETIYDPRQHAAVIAALTKRVKVDPASAERTYDYFTHSLRPFMQNASVPPAYVKSVMTMLHEAGDLKTADGPVGRYLAPDFVPK